MNLLIIPDDKKVVINGQCQEFDFSALIPSNIHAVRFDETLGCIEYNDDGIENLDITNVDDFSGVIRVFYERDESIVSAIETDERKVNVTRLSGREELIDKIDIGDIVYEELPLTRLKELKTTEMFNAFSIESNMDVLSNGYTFNGGLDSLNLLSVLHLRGETSLHTRLNEKIIVTLVELNAIYNDVFNAYSAAYEKYQVSLSQINSALSEAELDLITYD